MMGVVGENDDAALVGQLEEAGQAVVVHVRVGWNHPGVEARRAAVDFAVDDLDFHADAVDEVDPLLNRGTLVGGAPRYAAGVALDAAHALFVRFLRQAPGGGAHSF